MINTFANFTTKFVKRHAERCTVMVKAAKFCTEDEFAWRFSSLEHCFGVEKPSD